MGNAKRGHAGGRREKHECGLRRRRGTGWRNVRVWRDEAYDILRMRCVYRRGRERRNGYRVGKGERPGEDGLLYHITFHICGSLSTL